MMEDLEKDFPRDKHPEMWQPSFNPDEDWVQKFGRKAKPEEAAKIMASLDKTIEIPDFDTVVPDAGLHEAGDIIESFKEANG